MARIAGVDIPREKRLEISLTYIFGIGRTTAAADLRRAPSIDPDTRVRDLTDEEVNRIRAYIDANLKVEGDLRREVEQDIKRKMEIGCYQGLRHRRGLPVRGQRTHTNARTRKGPKKTVAGKKKVGRSNGEATSPAAVGPARRNARTSPTAWRTSRARSTTRSSSITDQEGNVLVVGLGRQRRLQGLPQVHAVRRPDGGRAVRPAGHGARRPQGRRASSRARARVARPPSARIQNTGIEVTGIKDVTPVPHNGCRPPKRRRV